MRRDWEPEDLIAAWTLRDDNCAGDPARAAGLLHADLGVVEVQML
jgi:hypothetical protein